MNKLNSEFWEELCGTNSAKVLGVTDGSPASLLLYDEWFFGFYPYLKSHLKPIINTRGKVLEVGLGYGSVATHLMLEGVAYTGLDIAGAPVEMANKRAAYLGLQKEVGVVGNVLNLSFDQCEFDAVVAIGSLHHTGDFDKAIGELIRTLKPDGLAVGMVYSLFSFRNWTKKPLLLTKELIKNYRSSGSRICADEEFRWMSDHNSYGEAAPATEYFSRRALRSVLVEHGAVKIRSRNLDTVPILGGWFPRIRIWMMRTPLPRLLGLDLYFKIIKRG